MKPKTIFLLTILMAYALGIAAQSVLTTDAMIRVAEQKMAQMKTSVGA